MKPRIHNIYTEESILLSYTPVEEGIVNLQHSTSEFAHFSFVITTELNMILIEHVPNNVTSITWESVVELVILIMM